MRADRPSSTARRVAFVRAAHQVLDSPRVMEDSIALRMLGPGAEARIRASERKLRSGIAEALRGFLIARSRCAEDALAEAVAAGVVQYVVLGAGFDTFAYRNPHAPDRLRVFEVDFPATQEAKRRRLAGMKIPIPGSLTFVPVDFETQTLPGRLRESGFRDDHPAFFSWLGVTMYLRRETIFSTLRFVAGLPQGSGVTFDYFAPPGRLPLVARLFFSLAALRVAIGGEPWRTWFEPDELAIELRSMGFRTLEDLDTAALNQRFFAGRMPRLGGRGVGRVMTARK